MKSEYDDASVTRSPQPVGVKLLKITVVVIIIGILATIAFKEFRRQLPAARIQVTEYEISKILTAIGNYKTEKGNYPESLADLVSGEKHFLEHDKVPMDAWGHEFKYHIVVKIRSAGPDGMFDTEDDIENK